MYPDPRGRLGSPRAAHLHSSCIKCNVSKRYSASSWTKKIVWSSVTLPTPSKPDKDDMLPGISPPGSTGVIFVMDRSMANGLSYLHIDKLKANINQMGLSFLFASNLRNPTGQAVKGAELEELVQVSRNGQTVVLDEFYSWYNLDGQLGESLSAAKYYEERSELPEGPPSSVSWNASDPGARWRQLARPNGVEGSARLTIPTLSAQLPANPQASELQILRNRTVVFIGDSLERNEVFHLAQETFSQTSHWFLMPQDLTLIHSPAHQSHRFGIGAHPDLGFSIANWFLMSVDIDIPTTPFSHPDEAPPQNFKARFEKFYKPLIYNHLEILTSAPDLIVFHSGLWYLVFLSKRKDYQINQNRTQGIMSKVQVTRHELLSKSEIELHSNRFKKFLNKLTFDTFKKQTGDQKGGLDLCTGQRPTPR
ncbi:hypothetical protein PGT21_017778 [Puccinia graminis f. sp. tritici]|uniref:Uncharacterized protein n=1 Tax=Puccinia graminis f. sp. tritici TaxID=56615 RepID=A0A5B0PXV6_PUCGR|nr:hypothetical protein PGT21_017778 [Puccinia graminis f. sp. tritici]